MASELKEKFVQELSEDLKKSPHVLITEYQGLNTEEMIELRSKLAPLGVKYKVIKNRLAKIAVKNAGWSGLDDFLKGPTALAYHGTDTGEITKIIFDFSKAHTNLKVKAGHLFGNAVDSKGIKEIADLPSREVLLATLLARMNGPLQSLVGALHEPLRSLHAVLTQLAKKKEAAPAA